MRSTIATARGGRSEGRRMLAVEALAAARTFIPSSTALANRIATLSGIRFGA